MNNKISANLTRHYNEKYSNQSGPPQEVKLRRYPRERFEVTVKWAEGGEKMLDIGSGHGNVIQALRPLYKECVGTEISTPRVTLLKQNFADYPNVADIGSTVRNLTPEGLIHNIHIGPILLLFRYMGY